MGEPKLTLPFGSATVIGTVVAAFRLEPIADVVVVASGADLKLCETAEAAGASVVRLRHPSPDMRFSVQAGLDWVESEHDTTPDDGWLLAPGDCVGLNRTSVEMIAKQWQVCDADVLVPVVAGKRGHPTCFRWHLVEQLRDLDSAVGVNSLLKSDTVRVEEFRTSDAGTLSDMDTPDDYAHAKRLFAKDVPK